MNRKSRNVQIEFDSTVRAVTKRLAFYATLGGVGHTEQIFIEIDDPGLGIRMYL